MNKDNVLEMFLTLNAEAFKKGLSAAGTGVRNTAGGISNAFAATRARLQENVIAVKNYNAQLKEQSGITQTLKGHVAALAGVVGVSISVMAGMGKLVGITREFDKLNAGLITATGSAAGAKEKFAWIQDFAADTPYDLAQVTDGFIKLTNFGLDPSERAMTSYGNTSSALGKDLNQMIEAVADAATGEFERLKEFGIKAKSEGDKVSFTFRGITTTVGKNAKEIEEYLIRLGETNFGDAMANRMTTLDGALSNLGDEWDKVFLNISQSGIGDLIADGVRVAISLLEKLNAKIKSGELEGFIRANKETIIIIGEVVAGVVALAAAAAALAPVIYSTTAVWRAMNMVMLASTGSQLLPWLGSIVTTLRTVQIAALSTAGALGAAAGATLALIGGYAIGQKIAEWEYLNDVVKANKTAIGEVPAKLAAISKETGVTVRSMDELFKAQKDGLLKFNDVTGAWEKVTKAAEKSADDQAKAQKEATSEMKKAYQDYANTVKKLQDDIAGREQDLTAQLREMGRSGMSDLGAWKDRKREAEEYGAAARQAAEESKKAFAAGDTATGQAKAEQAVQLYDKAKDAAADLNREIKAGDTTIVSQQQNLKTAMSMVEDYGKAGIEVQKNLKQAITDAATALNQQTGGKLAEELPEVAKQFGQVTEKAEDLAKKSTDFSAAWNGAWHDFLETGKKDIYDLDNRLSELTKDRNITVHVKEVVGKSTGGLIGYMRGGLIQALATGGTVVRNILAGGWLPGFGGGDTVPLMGERGEVMINKDAVQEAGLPAALAFNAKRWNVVISELLKMTGGNLGDILGYRFGGLIGDNIQGVQALAAGGSVQGGTSPLIRHEHIFRAGNTTAKVYTDDLNAGRVLAVFERAERMSS